MSKTFVKEWFDLCAAREAALEERSRGIISSEIQNEWGRASKYFTDAIKKAGLTYHNPNGADYTYKLSNGEVYLRDEPL